MTYTADAITTDALVNDARASEARFLYAMGYVDADMLELFAEAEDVRDDIACADAFNNAQPVHVLRNGSTMFHAMDCPACIDTPFTASPRSETYWCS